MSGMMRLVRNSKWQWTFFAGASTLVVVALVYVVWLMTAGESPHQELWLSYAGAALTVTVAVSYVMAQRTQRKLDQLQLAMKQVSAGNWSMRLPVQDGDAFAGAYREFNAMLDRLEDRLNLLQQLGEKNILEDAPSHEAAVLEERRRLARDLHDTVSQQLFALHMSASSLPMLLKKDAAQAHKVMEQLIAMSSSAQKQMRGLIAQLRPLELQGRSLPEALDRWFPDYCRQNGLQGSLDIQLRGRLSEAKEHQLFLIIQEAMANVVKHAGPCEIRLSLGETDRQVMLTIEDDGVGFTPDRVRSGSFGLSTMRERAQKLGGEAEIVTKQGAGTRVKVWFPKFEPQPERRQS